MRKNVASQNIAFQMNSTTDGSPVTSGTPTVYYTIDAGAQGTGAGASVHEGNGQWSYAPAQAETNGAHVAFTMALASAISQTVNVWPVAYDPGDAVRLGVTALPNAAADAAGGLPISDAGGLDLDGVLSGNVPQTADHTAALADIPTVAEFNARTLVAASYFDPAADTVANVTAVGSVSGAVGSVTGAVGSVAGNVDGNVTGSVGSLAAQAKLDVNAEADTALTDYDGPTYDELEGFMQLALRSDAAIETDRSTLLTAINANEGSGAGNFSAQTESQEALRDQGDSAWTTATSVTVSDKTGFSLAADQSAVTIGTVTTNTDMRGTDNAALASVVGALTDAAAAGDPTTADTVMQYIKQLINVLAGTAGIATFPAEAAPGNNVSIAEVLRAIHVDVTGLNGDAMRGTDSAYTGTPPTAAAIVDEWETQSQADPTGFHTNVLEIGGTGQTANDNGADINTLVTRVTAAVATEAKQDIIDTVVDRIEVDTQDIQSRIPSALLAVDVTFSAGGSTTTAVLNQVDGAGASVIDDVYNGRVLVFTAPAGLKYQATDITDYDGGTVTATITAVTASVGATATAILI